MASVTYEVILSPGARRALAEELPETVAAACFEFVKGPLADSPRQVGKRLRNDLAGTYAARRGEFRVIYDVDDTRIRVEVISIRQGLQTLIRVESGRRLAALGGTASQASAAPRGRASAGDSR